MDLESVIQNKVREKQIYINACMWNLKNGTDEPSFRAGAEMQMESKDV